MAKILVTGASGLLGCALVPHLRADGHEVLTHAHRADGDFQVDLTQAAPAWDMLDACRPDVVINLAALTNVDVCEREPQQAYLLNVKTVQNLAVWIMRRRREQREQERLDCYLLQISSDQVYDAEHDKHGPFAEEAVTLRNTYAFSKIAAELAALQAGGCALRTNFFGRSARAGRVSFSDWLAQSLRAGQAISVFDDVLFAPLSMPTLVRMLAAVLARRPQGVFNLGSRNGMSKADFAFAFAQAAGLPVASMQRAASLGAAQLQARRPNDMRMDCAAIEAVLQTSMPDLIDEITLCGRQYREPA